MASLGKLDDLVGMVYTEEAGQLTQSEVSTAPNPTTSTGGTVSSVTLKTTGAPLGGVAGGQLNFAVTSVSDATNTIQIATTVGGNAVGSTAWNVIGFNSTGVLISAVDQNMLAGVYSAGAVSVADGDLAILSPSVVPANLTETFTSAGSTVPTPPPSPITGLMATDTTTGQPSIAAPTAYSGPVTGLTDQFISPNADSLNITATTPGWFIKGGPGADAIKVASGTNVIDGGGGSDFLTGGSGNDTFVIDDQTATSDLWSTIANFHPGDSLTLYGVNQRDFALAFSDGGGALGETGFTMHATEAGKPTASFTLVGLTTADYNSGKISITSNVSTTGGTSYLEVHYNT